MEQPPAAPQIEPDHIDHPLTGTAEPCAGGNGLLPIQAVAVSRRRSPVLVEAWPGVGKAGVAEQAELLVRARRLAPLSRTARVALARLVQEPLAYHLMNAGDVGRSLVRKGLVERPRGPLAPVTPLGLTVAELLGLVGWWSDKITDAFRKEGW